MAGGSFLFYRQALWFWIAFISCLIFSLLYIWHDPLGGRSGGTTFGLTVGTVCAIAMCFLMLYSKRKRDYHSNFGTLKAWLSAHVWVGLSLIILVPLHSGFQFSCNLHTLCYIFILITVLSGIWGTYLFIAYPPKILARREGYTLKSILSDIGQLGDQITDSLQGKSGNIYSSIESINKLEVPDAWDILFYGKKTERHLDKARLAEELQLLTDDEQHDALNLINLIDQKSDLINKLINEVRRLSLLRVWLYLHLPFAVMSFVLLLVHIFTVFYLF